ncbi:OmcA/MtrC family decaheme c-type cytochrome [Geomonas sp. Red69]|uniref:OmcA/MtrC family decaheme c-type cytochrome n=1 Tax=Geomonas diazotrophica TaxID=2843197 RepID=UPI001C11D13B|nr:OmcA/MtrC family decaheme c-type cytochrome [Geomonas diazotrophica]MBU5638693.1 OmcA/MtrC family decaheme c-type cytochrome [Geomonas diazotrophica]
MIGRNLRYLVALVVCVLLPLAGCSGGGSTTKLTSKGTEVTVGGKVDVAKAAAKTAFLSSTSASAVNHVFVYNAQDGAQLGTATIGSDGSFSGLTFTLPAAKTVLVFKAVVAQGTFRSLVPVDLSNPPTAGGISASNPISIVISQQSTDITAAVSAMLGLSGVLGDANQTLASVNKTYTDCATQVVNAGGQVLAYTSTGLALSGTVSNANMLPAADASTLTVDDLNNIALSGGITSAFIPGKKPIVNFTVTNKATGKGIKGLRTFALHVAKLVPANATTGANSYWQNYISSGLPLASIPAFVNRGSSTPVAPTVPSTDASDLYVNGVKIADGYKVIDHGDGSYTVTFGADITANTNVAYDATATHRIGISVRSVAVPGGYAGPINPATNAVQAVFTTPNTTNMFYDFTPSTAVALTSYARDIVATSTCDSCHYKLGLAAGNMLSGHTGSRVDTKLCVMCHTDQFDSGEGEFVTFIHRIHMGETFNDTNSSWTVPAEGLVTYGEQTYPQDIRNCRFCHKGTDVNAWMSNPSRKACGSCHNAMTWSSHAGGQIDDSSCKGCHASGNTTIEISNAHLPVQAPDPNAPELGGTNTHTYAGYLPAAGVAVPGAPVITWDVKSVARDTNKHPTITFRFKKDGNPVVFNTYQAGVVTELMNGYTGSPSVYFAFAVPQDGVTAPADFNASASAWVKNVWNGTTATSSMTGPDTNGYYTITINNAIVPDTATMLTGGIGYTYGQSTPPLTLTDLSSLTVPSQFKTDWAFNATTKVGGLIVVTPNVWKVGTSYTGRRTIVSNAKCNACHAALGIAPTFHSGQRNDAPTCVFCHNVNKVNTLGWSVNTKDFVHAIHAAAKRNVKFSWEVAAGDTYWKTTYPGYLQDCEQCHVAGTYDFSATASANAVTSLLASTSATGTMPASVPAIVTGNETVPGTYYSPYVTANAAYGSGFSFTASSGAYTDAAGTTLVVSPITAACFSCHDTAQAQAHMKQFGGLINQARSNLATTSETCLVCHGTASSQLNERVPTIKAVHRWW